MKSLLVALVFVLASAALAMLFVGAGGPDGTGNASTTPSPLDAGYDYYVQDMQATRFGSDGTALSQLRAERVTHYPNGDRAELQAPAFEAFGTAAEAWQVSAASGTLTPEPERAEDRLDLVGNVELRKPQASGDFAEISTSALTVFTGSEQANTSEPVTLRTRNSRFEGVGLEARLAENHIQLKNGNGTHDPAPNP